MTLRPCIQCGQLSTASRCPTHRIHRTGKVRAGNPTGITILARDNYRCQLRYPGCTGRATVIDHRIPLAAGGGDDPMNLQAACHACNHRKGGVSR